MLGKADGCTMRNRETLQAGERERERERKGREAERAATLPLEGLPGGFWFLALVRPSCVPAHGLWELPRVLM